MHKNLIVNLKSLGPRYGCKNGFLLLLPAKYEEKLKQSKNLSIFAMKCDVSKAFPQLICIALETESLRTFKTHTCTTYYYILQTCTVKSTRIFEKLVSLMCSKVSFGTRQRPGVIALAPAFLWYNSTTSYQSIAYPLHCIGTVYIQEQFT